MKTTLRSLLAVAAVAALTTPALACEEVKGASTPCQTAVKTVASSAAGDCHGECPVQSAMNALMATLQKMDASGAEIPGRAEIRAAVLSLAKIDRIQACPKTIAALRAETDEGLASPAVLASRATAPDAAQTACGAGAGSVANVRTADGRSSCSSSGAGAVAAVRPAGASTCAASGSVAKVVTTEGATCSSSKGVVASVRTAGTGDSCSATCSGKSAGAKGVVANVTSGAADGAGCCAAKKAGAAQVADVRPVEGASGTGCTGAAKAHYVAFGCCKTDAVARAAARAYLSVLVELKKMAGVDGCAAQTASDLLASVVGELQSTRDVQTADADAGEPVAANLNVVTSVASCGADCSKSCCSPK